MAHKTLTFCDSCGMERGDFPKHWEFNIVMVNILCPKDGVNGPATRMDLCFNCRKKVNDFLSELKQRGDAAREGE